MGEFISESGALWENIPGTSLFVGSHPTAKGYAVVDAVTKEMIFLLPGEVAPSIAALQAKLPTPTPAPEAEVNDGE